MWPHSNNNIQSELNARPCRLQGGFVLVMMMTLGRKKGQTREQTRCSHFPIMPPRLTTPEEQTELRNNWTFSWVFWNVLRKSRHLWSCPHEASLTHDTKPSRSVKNVNISLGVYWKLKCSLFATIKKNKKIFPDPNLPLSTLVKVQLAHRSRRKPPH